MAPWKEAIKPSDIQKLASYILSLQGSNPANAKDPEGEIWVEGGSTTATEISTDTTAISTDEVTNVTDSTKVN